MTPDEDRERARRWPDPLIAIPGDPALDCHLTGLRLTSVVALETEDYDAEVALTYATSDAGGWWTDSSTGQRVIPDRVTSMTSTFGVKGHADNVSDMIAVLETWAAGKRLITLTAAPGKWTFLHCPDHPGAQLVIPRSGVLPSARERRPR